MADRALAEAMGQMKIEQKATQQSHLHTSNHHVLGFCYPDFSITIPFNEQVELMPPANIGHRSRPPQNPVHLALYDTSFEVALPLRDQAANGPLCQTEYMRLFAAVEALSSCAGTTTMGVLRLHHDAWDETRFRIRLESRWIGPSSKTPPQEFELDGSDWEALLSFAGQRTWIAILKHLVNRESAKAYYHVRQRVAASCGPDVADEEEKSWQESWGTKRPIYAAELFAGRFIPMRENIQAGEMPQLMLECGHAYHLNCDEALKVNGNVVFREVCQTCKAPVMQTEDKQYLHAVIEKHTVWQFAKMQRVWARLVEDHKKPEKAQRFHAMSIFRVLGAALDSLRPPESVAPTAICPSNFEATKLVLEHLESMFWDFNDVYLRTADELLVDLENEAMGVRMDGVALGERVNTPGWDDFLARWLRRTAYFLANRRCCLRERGCKGFHAHQDGLWYCPRDWEEEEAETYEEDTDVFQTSELRKALEAIAFSYVRGEKDRHRQDCRY